MSLPFEKNVTKLRRLCQTYVQFGATYVFLSKCKEYVVAHSRSSLPAAVKKLPQPRLTLRYVRQKNNAQSRKMDENNTVIHRD